MDRRSRAPWAHRQELRAAHTDSRAARPGPHPPPATARTHRARFAGERHEAFGVAVVATEAREAPGPDATAQELAELIGNSSGLSGRAGCHNVQSRTLVLVLPSATADGDPIRESRHAERGIDLV